MKTTKLASRRSTRVIVSLIASLLVLTLISNRQNALAEFAGLSVSTLASVPNQAQGKQSQPQAAVGSTFTYQGQLKDGGNPANGQYDFTFKLYDASSGGTQVGSTLTMSNQTVSSGLFTVQLDFGATAYQGDGRWMEIAVRVAGGPTYTTLSPRQALTATPYAASLMPGAIINSTTASTAISASASGVGLQGTSTGTGSLNAGVYGISTGNNGSGVRGQANVGTAPAGVWGESTTGYGVWGQSTGGASRAGVYGRNDLGFGVQGFSNGGYGMYGTSSTSYGVYGTSDSNWGIKGSGTSGVWGDATASNGTGVSGSSPSGIGVSGTTAGGATVSAVSGTSTGANGVGVAGLATNGATALGVWGSTTGGRGVYGSASTGVGVYGASNSGYAGYFLGNVRITGTCCGASQGTFKIDHPADPEGKYLVQAAVESPDMKTVYDGVATFDSKGEAAISLPSYVEALNTDFRYQLTCIGGFAPVYIAQEITGNSFRIAGGKAGMKVSWQVTGIRKDPYAQAHPIQVEVEKPADQQGKYLHPAEYGQPESKGVDYRKPEPVEQKELDKGQPSQHDLP